MHEPAITGKKADTHGPIDKKKVTPHHTHTFVIRVVLSEALPDPPKLIDGGGEGL